MLQHLATGGLSSTYLHLLVAARLLGVFVAAPALSGCAIPLAVRLGFVTLLTLVIAPSLMSASSPNSLITLASFTSFDGSSSSVLRTSGAQLGLLIANEILVGTLMGIGVLGVFSGLRLGGELLDRQSGLGMGAVLNPSWLTDGSASGALVQLLGIAAFVLIEPIGGPLLLLQSLLQSFHVIPVGAGSETIIGVELLNGIVHQSLVLGLRVAMPLIAAMTLVDMSLAFAGRTAALPLSSSHLAIRTGCGLVVLALTITAIPEVIVSTTSTVLHSLVQTP